MNFNYDDDHQDSPRRSYQNSHEAIEKASNTTVNLSHEGEHHNDFGSNGDIPVSRSTKIFAICAALNSCNLGFDIGVNTSAGQLLQDADSLALSTTQLEIFNGSLNLFAAFGAIAASAISDRFGRRRGFIVAAIGFIFGVLLMTFAQSYAFLMFGRIFVGLGVGFGLAIDPIYIAELSPAKHRGRLVTWSEIATNVGILIGFSSGLIFNNVQPDSAWRLMFGMGTIMPVTLIALVIRVMPESPRWLVKQGREAEAEQVLSLVYPEGYNTSAVVNDIKDAITREEAAEQAIGWGVIFSPSPAYKRMLFVGLGSAIAQQLVGIDAVQYFMMYIIERTGIKSRTTQSIILIFLGLLKLAVIFIAGNLFDSRGRRPLIFASLIGMSVACFMIAITFVMEDGTLLGIVALALYLSFFSLGMGPGAWLIPAEVFSTTIRAKAMSMATFLNRITATIVTSTFLTVAESISWAGYFSILGIICLLVLLYLFIYLPETKGRSLEDMSLYFAEVTGDNAILEAEKRLHAGTGGPMSPSSGTTGTLA